MGSYTEYAASQVDWAPILVGSVMWWGMETTWAGSHIIRLLPVPPSLQCVTGEHSPIRAILTLTHCPEPWSEVQPHRMITTRMTGRTTSWRRLLWTITQDSKEQWLDSWLGPVTNSLALEWEHMYYWIHSN